MAADAVTAERIVVDDVWGPFDRRATALREESRKHLDRRRRRALLYDGLLLAPVSIGCALMAGDVLALAIALSYFFVCEALTGQTWGKRRMGLRVVRLDGRPLSIASAATRNVLLPVDAIGCYLVGYFAMVASRHRQRVGDLLAGTVVTEAWAHPHVAGDERGRTAMIAGYPVAWIATAVVAVAVVSGSAATAYAIQVDRICSDAWASTSGVDGVEGLRRAGLVSGDLGQVLATMTPPADLRVQHERLVAAERSMSAEYMAAAARAAASPDPPAAAESIGVRFEVEREANARALAGTGLEACL
jgi:uncharacterized RDD family membrane protein YckC